MQSLLTRRIDLSDVAALQRLCRQTFSETFAGVNTAENMRKYLDEDFSIDKLSAEISNPLSEFYFAEWDGTVVGYLKLNFGQAQTEMPDEQAVEIERIYVLKEYHGKQVGQVLFEIAVEVSEWHHASFLWLGVWEKNYRAVQFYRKNGFKVFGNHIFHLGNELQTDLMMRRMPGEQAMGL